MSVSPKFLEELLVLKKQQATELFGPWDVEDEGRIAVKRVRPLLLSVFPEATDAPPCLSLQRVITAYEGATHRPWHAPSSVAAASATASPHARRPQDPMYVGPTLDEVHRIIDALASGSGTSADRTAPALQGTSKVTQAVLAQGRTLPLSASLSLRGSSSVNAGAREDAKEVGAASTDRSAEALLWLLRGSIEQIYRSLCAACAAVGDGVPDVLPTDAAHLSRLVWTVEARHLRCGEAHALQRLCAPMARSDEGAQTANGISADAFVQLLCTL